MAGETAPWYSPQGGEKVIRETAPEGAPEGSAPITQTDGTVIYLPVAVVEDL